MAAAYAFILLVELNGNLKIPKLKNKLVKYFQSKKSNGGDCLVKYEDGDEAEVRFKSEEVRKRVFEKQDHEIQLDLGLLKLKTRLPPDEVPKTLRETQSPVNLGKSSLTYPKDSHKSLDGDGNTFLSPRRQNMEVELMKVKEELESTSAVLGNIEENMDQFFLEMLIENILGPHESPGCDSVTETQPFNLEILHPALNTHLAVVTFQNAKDTMDFITSCNSNRMFKQKQLTVRLLEITKKVKIENIPPNIDSDYLQLSFGKEDEEVEVAEIDEEDQSVILTFQDPKAFHRALQRPHLIQKQLIKAFPFYDSLGTALYGKDRATLTIPSAFTENIDLTIWRYICNNQEAADTIHKEMIKHFCKVDLHQPNIKLSPLPSLLKQKCVKPKHVQQWKDTTKAALVQTLSNFKSLDLKVEDTAWEESKGDICRAVLRESVIVVPDQARSVLVVVGFAKDVDRLRETLVGIVERITRRIDREKTSISEEFPLAPNIYHMLLQDGLLDMIGNEFPELKLTYNRESQNVTIYGLTQEVLGANRKLINGVLALKRKVLELDDYLVKFLQDEDQEKLTISLFTPQRINAAIEIEKDRVLLLAFTEEALVDAEHQLNTLLMSQYIHVEDSNVLKMSEWKKLVTCLGESSNPPFMKVMIQITSDYSDLKVVVSGFNETVLSVRNELKDFLQQNTHVDETIQVMPEVIGKFIQEHHKDAWLNRVREGRVKVCFKNEAIHLSGTRAHVRDCKALFENLVSSTFFDTLKVSKPGAKMFFQDKETMYVSMIMSQTGCVVQLVEGDYNDKSMQGIMRSRGVKPTYKLQTTDGVEIAVCKADMCRYSVHAVVNAAALDLKHSGGLAGALLNAVGPQMQYECDQIIKNQGHLKPGDSVITSAGGKLHCKSIIHAVGPKFDKTNPQKAIGQLRRAIKGSLDLAVTHNCLYVAIPAISSGNLGFPLALCADTIVKSIKEYCDDKFGDNTLQKIHLVNNDELTVQAMEVAVRKVFGSHGTSIPKPSRRTTATISQPGNQVQGTSSSNRVQTKEGLAIVLIKGNIQEAVMEVVVNTVGKDLALKHGAVSNAILTVAGPQLQTLVDQQAYGSVVGDLIVTPGCNLKCKQVFHTVAPHWDNGQGPAQKILTKIVQQCLSEAEQQGLLSISFPAIGTGNLGFPKDLASTLMLDEVLRFSRKQHPKNLKEVAFVLHPDDAPTIQAFTNEFNKRFASQLGKSGSAVASSQPNTGPFSKVISSSGQHETNMGGIVIQVVTGDITKETTDVIVNSSDASFSLQSGVSKAILDAAGQTVVAECQRLGAQPNSGAILTQPGNLMCKQIIHLVGQTDPKKIQEVVKAALQMCSLNHLTSISFPAIGTGQGNVQAGQVADAMFDAIVEFVRQKPQNTLKLVRLVVFQPAMLTEFQKSMMKKEDPGVQSKEKSGIWATIKSLFTLGKADKSLKDEDFIIECQEVDPAFFHICGKSQDMVDQAKHWIEDLIMKEQVSNSIIDNALLNLSVSDRQRIDSMQTTMGVGVTMEYSSLKQEAKLTIEGLSKDVLNAVNDIQELLRKARDKEAFDKNVELNGNMVEWQYELQPGRQYQSFDQITNFLLEQALENNQPHAEVSVQGQMYKVGLPNGPATSTNGNSLKIKRINKLEAQPVDSLPPHWDTMPANNSCHSFLIQPGSPEHNDVLNLFQATCPNNIIKIERIQNPSLWKNFQIKKGEMELRNSHKNNEKRLFHGMCWTTINHINHHGFNRSYAGKNAAAYGNGTYFAVDARYSASNVYSKPDSQGQKYMYLCRVLTGDFTNGKQGMIVPPAKNPTTALLYDSVTDNPARPSMFVVFNDIQAYPEHLITFR